MMRGPDGLMRRPASGRAGPATERRSTPANGLQRMRGDGPSGVRRGARGWYTTETGRHLTVYGLLRTTTALHIDARRGRRLAHGLTSSSTRRLRRGRFLHPRTVMIDPEGRRRSCAGPTRAAGITPAQQIAEGGNV